MTQNNMPQPATAEELWAAYDGLKDEDRRLRRSWLELHDEHHRASTVAHEVFERSSVAWEAYRSVNSRLVELYYAARDAEARENQTESVKLAA